MTPASLQKNYRNELMRCGHQKYILNQKWSKYEFNDKKMKYVSKLFNLSLKLLKENDGVWIPEQSDSKNYKDLKDKEQKQIQLQVEEMIEKNYEFINYNGWNHKRFDT